MEAYAGIDLHSTNSYIGIIDEQHRRCTGLNQDLQNQLNERQRLFGVAMQKTIVSNPAETFG